MQRPQAEPGLWMRNDDSLGGEPTGWERATCSTIIITGGYEAALNGTRWLNIMVHLHQQQLGCSALEANSLLLVEMLLLFTANEEGTDQQHIEAEEASSRVGFKHQSTIARRIGVLYKR